MKCAVTVTYDTVATDVHASHVIATLPASIKVSKTFDLVSLYSVGSAVSVKYRREGILYFGSSVRTMPRKPSFSTTEYGLKSIAINLAMDLVLPFLSSVAAVLPDQLSSGWKYPKYLI